MSSEQPRRSRETASNTSPVGSTAAIIIAVVAVVAGFLILGQIRDDRPSAGSIDTTTTTLAVVETVPTTIPIVTETTVAPLVTEGATAVVANASGVNGAAGTLTTALSGKAFTMAKAINGSEKRTETAVYYDETNPAALAVATSIAALLGSEVTVQPLASPAPVEGGTLPAEVSVLVMLGSDKATKTLDEMSGATATTAVPTTVPALATPTTV